MRTKACSSSVSLHSDVGKIVTGVLDSVLTLLADVINIDVRVCSSAGSDTSSNGSAGTGSDEILADIAVAVAMMTVSEIESSHENSLATL